VSSLVSVRSATLASGQYALNGTFNVAEVQSFPQEAWKKDYDEILPFAPPAKVRENV